MDFARRHVAEPSAASQSGIRYIPPPNDHLETETAPLKTLTTTSTPSLDDMVLQTANNTAVELLLGPKPRVSQKEITLPDDLQKEDMNVEEDASKSIEDEKSPDQDEKLTADQIALVDASLYPDYMTPQELTIQPGQLVVIFESFDNLNFTYAKPGDVFNNRNGNFHHDDFIGKPFGCHIRSRNNRGYGFCYILKPTPELWARSLNHRTQIVHELDASMIVHYLQLQPNMVVCESGTGSGALSHCLLRTIAPYGHLYTYEFNKPRSDTAVEEFEKNGVGHLVTVRHKDVCGKQDERGGFDRPGQSVDAVVLDLPEPWLAIPHAAFVLRPNGRIATYSPCVEQSQKAVATLKKYGFHSMETKEFRLREYYVDEFTYDEGPPRKKRVVPPPNPHSLEKQQLPSETKEADSPGKDTKESNMRQPKAVADGHDTGAEADNEKSEYETEGDQGSLATAEDADKAVSPATPRMIDPILSKTLSGSNAATAASVPAPSSAVGRKTILAARPFSMMRGHTAFLTFATAGNMLQPDPNA